MFFRLDFTEVIVAKGCNDVSFRPCSFVPRLSFEAHPSFSAVKCEFSEQTTSSSAGQVKEVSVSVQEHLQ